MKSRLKAEFKEATITLPRYIAVGISGVIIGMVTIWCFTELIGLFYLVSGCISALFSILNDFTFNEIWTFSHRRKERLFTIGLGKHLAKFIVSRVVGFLVAISVLALFTQVVGLHYLISNFIAVGASFIWNYAASTFWVWSRRK